MTSVKIINLETGHVIEADPYVLREQCIPYGYRFAEEITVEEWIEALQKPAGGKHRCLIHVYLNPYPPSRGSSMS